MKRDLSYETIVAAKHEDVDAVKAIINYYEPYIIDLSSFPECDGNGKIRYRIDRNLYIRLKLKLYSLIGKFEIMD